jgi:hypothetical protein
VRLDALRSEDRAEPRDVDLQGRLWLIGQILAPQGVDQMLGGHDPVGAQHQMGEHDPLLRASQGKRAVLPGDLERPKDTETHGPTVLPAFRARNPPAERGSRVHALQVPSDTFQCAYSHRPRKPSPTVKAVCKSIEVGLKALRAMLLREMDVALNDARGREDAMGRKGNRTRSAAAAVVTLANPLLPTSGWRRFARHRRSPS